MAPWPPTLPPAPGRVRDDPGGAARAGRARPVPAALPGGGPHRAAGDRRRLRAASAGRSAGRGGGRPAPRRRPDDPHHHARRRRTVPRRARRRTGRGVPAGHRPRPGPPPRRRACRRPGGAARWFAFGAGVLAQVASAPRAGRRPVRGPAVARALRPGPVDRARRRSGQRGRVARRHRPRAPYLYVGPWEPRPGGLWNEPWGASLGYEAIRAGPGPDSSSSRWHCGPCSS